MALVKTSGFDGPLIVANRDRYPDTCSHIRKVRHR